MINNKKRLMFFILLSTVLISVLPFVAAQDILENMFGGIKNTFSDSFGSTPTDIISSVVITLILFAVFYDLLTLIPFFHTEWVKYIVAGGVAIIGVLFRWPISIANYGLGIAAGLGAIGVALVIGFLAILLIGLVFGAKWAQKWALHRRGMMHEIRAAEGAQDVSDAVTNLKTIDRAIRRR